MAIIVAFYFPQFGTVDYQGFNLSSIIDLGIIAVFLFYGLKLDWKAIPTDLKNWPLHVLVQVTTFVVFPLLVLCTYPLVQLDQQLFPLFLGFFFLACLPSTVSSSVVMVSIAKGNMSSAIFNASISGLLGVALTPLWMSLFIQHNSADFDFTAIFLDLILKIIVPVIIGGLLQPYLGGFYNRYKTYFAKLDQLTIILIVYQSFSHTFQEGLFQKIPLTHLWILSGLVIALFFIVFYFTKQVARFFKFNREDAITIQFCGTKKSLVHGSVIGALLFSSDLGLYLIPIMLYHTFQLLFISYKANRYAQEIA